VEARFGVLSGVIRTRVGYSGGTKEHPTYRSLGDHTETVEVDYDPTQISYGDLLKVFWASHHPGSAAWSRQYMNVIFYHNDEQKRLAEESKAQVAAQTGKPVQTVILPFTGFTLAEDYHQKYYLRQTPALVQELSRYYPDPGDLVNSRAAARLNGYVAGYGSPAQLKEELPGLGLSAETGQHLLASLTTKSKPSELCPVR
jgi:peptide-methionine (S)-S-oxide reductase